MLALATEACFPLPPIRFHQAPEASGSSGQHQPLRLWFNELPNTSHPPQEKFEAVDACRRRGIISYLSMVYRLVPFRMISDGNSRLMSAFTAAEQPASVFQRLSWLGRPPALPPGKLNVRLFGLV